MLLILGGRGSAPGSGGGGPPGGKFWGPPGAMLYPVAPPGYGAWGYGACPGTLGKLNTELAGSWNQLDDF